MKTSQISVACFETKLFVNFCYSFFECVFNYLPVYSSTSNRVGCIVGIPLHTCEWICLFELWLYLHERMHKRSLPELIQDVSRETIRNLWTLISKSFHYEKNYKKFNQLKKLRRRNLDTFPIVRERDLDFAYFPLVIVSIPYAWEGSKAGFLTQRSSIFDTQGFRDSDF